MQYSIMKPARPKNLPYRTETQETTHMTDYTSYKTLKIEKRDHVATVTINRPEARNSFNHELLTEIEKIWLDLADDTDVRAVLLTGAGATFSVGGDVKGMRERPGGDVLGKDE